METEDNSLFGATEIYLDGQKMSNSNPFGFSVEENNKSYPLTFKEITKEQQEEERLNAYDYLI